MIPVWIALSILVMLRSVSSNYLCRTGRALLSRLCKSITASVIYSRKRFNIFNLGHHMSLTGDKQFKIIDCYDKQ